MQLLDESAWQGGLLAWEVWGIGGLKEGRGGLGELLGMVGFQASKQVFIWVSALH